ncbi:5'-3' exoribonuclease [Phytophthora citrophthora]|uniref:5'-3' exoribonuclease n=1 Tax=Phytophthora citrophthora TaxID=4793 RepID=A0AAD9LSN8_9STRA|nr:5'-3' exoribonuclease [Phytophthora citrophthora]
MVGHRKKKKVKKSKRKAVNLQANFNRKCSLASRGTATDAAYETLSDAMFPSNDHHLSAHEHVDSRDAGDAACGDFHLHSDGKLKPSEVIAKAAANGVTYMSLTDHDTMAGVSEAIATAQKLGVLVFPGVEISAEVKGGENLHILGYFYPGSNSAELEKQLLKIRTGRHKRGKGMLKKLEAMGIKLKWERVLEIAGEAAPGRPHVAEALVEAGHVANFRQAFARYLHNDGPAYVEGEHFPPEEAIKLIASAGGVSVLAHPWCCKDPMNLVPELAKLGIQGIEVYHDANKIDMYGALAKESGLLRMGGSDFHGIDPTTERSPGAIPFPRVHIDRFLAHALDVWERPLVERLRSIAEVMKSADSGVEASEELLIWKEQEPLVRRTLAELGMGIEVVGSKAPEVEGSPTDEGVGIIESHYRTIRVSALSR